MQPEILVFGCDNYRGSHTKKLRGVTPRVCDIPDEPLLHQLFHAHDTLIHFASLTQVGEFIRLALQYLNNNIGGRRYIEASGRSLYNIQEVIFIRNIPSATGNSIHES